MPRSLKGASGPTPHSAAPSGAAGLPPHPRRHQADPNHSCRQTPRGRALASACRPPSTQGTGGGHGGRPSAAASVPGRGPCGGALRGFQNEPRVETVTGARQGPSCLRNKVQFSSKGNEQTHTNTTKHTITNYWAREEAGKVTPTHDHEKIDRQETRPSKDRDRTEPAGRGGVGGGPEAKVTTRREGLAHGTAEGQRRVRAGDPRAWGGGARAWGGARRTGGGALGARQTETEDKGERGAEPRAPGTPTGTPTPTRHLHHTGRAPTRGRVLRDRTRGVPGTPQVPAHPHRKENAGAVQVETADTMTQRDSGGPGDSATPRPREGSLSPPR